jgi:hypothetical protein
MCGGAGFPACVSSQLLIAIYLCYARLGTIALASIVCTVSPR